MKLISFDVSSFSAMVPLNYIIDITLKRIYGDKELETNIGRKDVKSLLLLYTENVHFTFGINIYQQKENAATGSSFGSVEAETFMVHVERTLMPELEQL